MTPALENAIERLREMPDERQDAFARMILREIIADEQWIRSKALNAEWQRKRAIQLSGVKISSNSATVS